MFTIFLLITELLIQLLLSVSRIFNKKTSYKIMIELIKKMIIGLITGLANGSNHIKCISLTNRKSMIQPTIINLYPN